MHSFEHLQSAMWLVSTLIMTYCEFYDFNKESIIPFAFHFEKPTMRGFILSAFTHSSFVHYYNNCAFFLVFGSVVHHLHQFSLCTWLLLLASSHSVGLVASFITKKSKIICAIGMSWMLYGVMGLLIYSRLHYWYQHATWYFYASLVLILVVFCLMHLLIHIIIQPWPSTIWAMISPEDYAHLACVLFGIVISLVLDHSNNIRWLDLETISQASLQSDYLHSLFYYFIIIGTIPSLVHSKIRAL